MRIVYPKRLLLNICWARNLPMPPALCINYVSRKGFFNYPIEARPRGIE